LTPARPRAAFLGSPEFAVPSLRALVRIADVPLVVTQPARPAGRGRRIEPTAVQVAATALGLPVLEWERGQRRAVESRLADLQLDVLVVVAFGHILRPTALATARRGAVNVHASLLPRWRGVAPIERAILAGDSETGVTLMVLDAGIDTGPTLAMQRVTIGREDTRVSLTERLAQAGAQLLEAHLAAWVEGRLAAVPQPEAGASYAPKLEKSEGRLDWNDDAASLAARVRGLYSWPGAFTTLAGRDLKVHAAGALAAPATAPPGTIVRADAAGVEVACGSGRLELREVQLAGKARTAAVELVRGRVLRAGQRLGS
jgi:methionyl-tRNA formyltransferase